jgi:hypothetical protein
MGTWGEGMRETLVLETLLVKCFVICLIFLGTHWNSIAKAETNASLL